MELIKLNVDEDCSIKNWNDQRIPNHYLFIEGTPKSLPLPSSDDPDKVLQEMVKKESSFIPKKANAYALSLLDESFLYFKKGEQFIVYSIQFYLDLLDQQEGVN